MNLFQTNYRGVLLSCLIGLLAWLMTIYSSFGFNSILLALILGMLAGNVRTLPSSVQPGISFTSSRLLELSILFLAFDINYTHIARLGAGSFLSIVILVFSILLAGYYLAGRLKCPGTTGWLIGFGTAICGSSAIAALSPTVTKNKEEVGIAMAVTNLLGSIGMVVLPFLLMRTGFTTTQAGLLLGGSLHSVGNVAGAGYSMGSEVGEASITIKLARVALLSPALIFFKFLIHRQETSNWKQHFTLPWYLWSFIGITVLSSLVTFPVFLTDVMDTTGKLVLTIAMAAIGLNVSFKKLYLSGKRGLAFGSIIFAIQVLLLLALAWLN